MQHETEEAEKIKKKRDAGDSKGDEVGPIVPTTWVAPRSSLNKGDTMSLTGALAPDVAEIKAR